MRRFDIVEFRYSMDDKNRIFKGLIVDNYLLNQEQWIKILSNKEISEIFKEQSSQTNCYANVVYKLDSSDNHELIQNFVGTVIEKSKIDVIIFL